VPDGVNLADLTAATSTPLVLEEGGTAKVSQVTYAGRPYIFKCYFDELRETVRPAELQRMLDWHDRRPAADRAWLNVGAAWVRHLVWDGELFTGVLLPQAAPEFIAGRQPRTLGDLAHTPPDGGTRTDLQTTKLNAYGHLIAAVAWFHERGVVVNDLHAHNVLVRANGDGVYIVDCDSMVGDHWAPVLPNNPAPDNMRDVVPGVDRPTRATDFGRLAQVILTTLLNLEVAEIATHSEDPIFARLCELLTEPVARFVCATRDGAFGEDAAAEWGRLGEQWRRPARATAALATRVPPLDGWNPIGGPLLPEPDLSRISWPELEGHGGNALLNLLGPDAADPIGSPIRRFPPAEIRSHSSVSPRSSFGPRRPDHLIVALVVFGILAALVLWTVA
jgi:hypothetical protein